MTSLATKVSENTTDSKKHYLYLNNNFITSHFNNSLVFLYLSQILFKESNVS